jgi:hypothetical protein
LCVSKANAEELDSRISANLGYRPGVLDMSIWTRLWPFKRNEIRFRSAAIRPTPIALTEAVNLLAAHANLIRQQRAEVITPRALNRDE